MKFKAVLFFSVMLLVVPLFRADAADRNWSVGDSCLANWSHDDYWYPGTIIEVDRGEFHIQFDDGDREWLPADSLVEENLGIGSVVYANWKVAGTYYSGKITERIGDVIWMHYDDGDEEWTTIAFVRVLF